MKTLLVTLSVLGVFLSSSPAQAQKTQLKKAVIGSPAAYMRKIRNLPRRGRGPVVFEEKYDFEKAGPPSSLRDFTLKDFITIAPDTTKANLKPEFVPPVFQRINADLGGHGGKDPMVAVGEKSIAVANTTWVRFYNKVTGKRLAAGRQGEGHLDVSDLFGIYLWPSSSEWVSLFYNIPWDVPYYCTKDVPCDKAKEVQHDSFSGLPLPCSQRIDEGTAREAYDVRVIYQKEHRRYVIVAALRNNTSRDNDYYNPSASRDCSQYLLRLVGIAVSISEDPNDGFHFYRTDENNYRDWPNVVADQDYLVLTHKGGGRFSEGKSIVTVYPFRQMVDGAPTVEGFSLKQMTVQDNTPTAVMPVTNVQSGDAFFFVEHGKGDQGQIKIWYLKKPPNPADIFNNPPTKLTAAGGQLTAPGANFSGGAYAGVTYYDNNIYLVSHQEFFPVSTPIMRAGYGLNVFRIPVHSLQSGGYEATTVGLDRQIFKNENYSYLNPSLGVDTQKNLVIQFIRLPRDLHSAEKPQLRVKVKFNAESQWRDSQLIKEWTVAHNNKKLVDYSWIVKDPFRMEYFWFAHRYRTGSKDMWVGRINISSQ